MRRQCLLALWLLASTSQAWSQFNGPSILSRPADPIALDKRESAEFRVHAGVNGVYESSVLLPGVDLQTRTEGVDLYGTEWTFGIAGTKSYRHRAVSVVYEGSYRAYTRNPYYNGSDHLIGLELQHQFSKRWRLTVRPVAGTLARVTGGLLASDAADDSLYAAPGLELYDNRVYFTEGSADLTYQATPRLSTNLGGDGFFVRRQNSALAGVTGAAARADVAYRLNKRQTIGAEYNFSYFTYDGAFGTYDAHMAAVLYSNQLTRRWQVNVRAGGYRIESLGLKRVTLDPAIAEILGTATGIGVGYGVCYLPQVEALVRRSARHGDLTFSYTKKLNPGNGILLLARDESVMVSFHQDVSRKLKAGFSAGRERLAGIGEMSAAFSAYTAGGGFAYQVWRYAYITGRLDWRQYEMVNGAFSRDTLRASLGLQVTTADTPVRLR